MFKVLIVDDEQIVIDGIKFMIEEIFTDVEVVAMANSGRTAIEVTRSIVPDIVLMDIKMPGINGIEAIEVIKKRHQDTKFIIISAYEQFEFAKQAVELGVSHYILKPISENRLKDTLGKVMNEIQSERLVRLSEIENKEKIEKIIPVLEHGFIYALLMNADYRQELYKYQELFEITKDKAYIMVLEFGDNGNKERLENRIGSGLKGFTFYPKVQSAIKYKCRSIVGPMIINRITVVVYAEESESEYEQRIAAIQLASAIKESVTTIVDTDLFIGIGGCYVFDKIKNSLEEAIFALNRMTNESVLHVNDMIKANQNNSDYTYVDIKEDETQIIELMKNGKEEELGSEIESFFIKVEKKFGQNMLDMRNIVTELMVMVLSSSYRNNLKEEEVGYSTYISEIKRIDNVVTLQNWCVQKIISIARLAQSKRHQHISTVVIEAKNYIDNNYDQEISLKEVSKMVSVSPQYFSKIFKEEIGLSFVEYIRMCRMDVAKNMLRQKIYSIKEVCYKIGYNDPNYFSRLFKKLVGVSPSDFE